MSSAASGPSDEHWMQIALDYAEQAKQVGEVPVGAVVVHNHQQIGAGYNQPISSQDATGHAELVALRQANQHMQNYRLPGTTVYVTLEPCMMCAGALIHARVNRLVYGATEAKAGVVCSHPLIGQPWLNHRIDIQGGVLAELCGQILSDFFAAKRAAN